MTDIELTEEQQAILAQLEAAVAARPKEEDLEGEPMSDKFSGPIGFDDNGNPFPLKPTPRPQQNDAKKED
ncbi:MAG TPA: hypothetical protein DCE42_05120 [Myxococcales bacterium]|nr:hypothetical protein [Deltaproteobacteria bacterium]MBU47854.1 hypothetical protein [Deltaproteobacteria bacterium]HAA54112.1 hypothetical protein [Myxococcales bacterium]|tara:strand:+ start:7595 stop:7804 length:210 start_codon:yes stop_codon:yes gene_type:complete